MTNEQALTALEQFVNDPSCGDDSEADAIEALEVIRRALGISKYFAKEQAHV